MSIADRVVINFHGIGTPWEGVPADEVDYWCPREQWPELADELAMLAEDGTAFDVTFDDGNLSDLAEAVPTLVERGLRATFFVCAGRIGQAHYLDASQLRDLISAGMDIGSHGWEHVDLRRVDPPTLARETVDARNKIQEAAGVGVDEFALPFGSYDRRVLRSLKRYRRVFSSDGGRMSPSVWLAPRVSYVRGWRTGDITRMARVHASRLDLWGRRARSTIKSFR